MTSRLPPDSRFNLHEKRQDLEERLRQELVGARCEFDTASENLKSFAPSPHSNPNPEAEIRHKYEVAYRRYSAALRRFTDLIVDRKSPADATADGESRGIP
jgi:hypothetical protein